MFSSTKPSGTTLSETVFGGNNLAGDWMNHLFINGVTPTNQNQTSFLIETVFSAVLC